MVWLASGNERGEWLSNLWFAVFDPENRHYKHFNVVCWCINIDMMCILICTTQPDFVLFFVNLFPVEDCNFGKMVGQVAESDVHSMILIQFRLTRGF